MFPGNSSIKWHLCPCSPHVRFGSASPSVRRCSMFFDIASAIGGSYCRSGPEWGNRRLLSAVTASHQSCHHPLLFVSCSMSASPIAILSPLDVTLSVVDCALKHKFLRVGAQSHWYTVHGRCWSWTKSVQKWHSQSLTCHGEKEGPKNSMGQKR